MYIKIIFYDRIFISYKYVLCYCLKCYYSDFICSSSCTFLLFNSEVFLDIYSVLSLESLCPHGAQSQLGADSYERMNYDTS